MTGEIMKDLELGEREANEALHVLQDAGLVSFTEQTGFLGSREELIIARVTGEGIREDDGRISGPTPPPSTGSAATPTPPASTITPRSAGGQGTPFLLKLVIMLVVALVVIVVAAFISYLALGITSIGYYQPPIGQVMAFVYNVAEIGGVACVAVFGLAAMLHRVPRFRKRIDELLGG